MDKNSDAPHSTSAFSQAGAEEKTQQKRLSIKRALAEAEESGAKRQRPDNSDRDASQKPEANLGTLAAELRSKIFRETTDRSDPRSSIKNAALARRINLHWFKTAVSIYRNEKKIVNLIRIFGKNAKIIDAVAEKSKNFELDSELIPLKTVKERSEIFKNILDISDANIKKEKIIGLILNIYYADADDRSKISKNVCDLQQKMGGAEDLVKLLIERSEALAPAERASLVEVTRGIEDVKKRRDCLNTWACKMDLIKDHQLSVLTLICEGEDTGFSLGLLAKHLDKILPVNRNFVAQNVIGLSPHFSGRLWALSQLAANLNYLEMNSASSEEPLPRKVASTILAELTQEIRERPTGNQSLWYTDPILCKGEAIHHLKEHEKILDGPQLEKIEKYIEKILNSPNISDIPIQAQFLPHMSEENRAGFIKNSTETLEAEEDESWNHPFGENPLEKTKEDEFFWGLTLRVKSLTDTEKNEYVKNALYHGDNRCLIIEAARHGFNENILSFNFDQRKDLSRLAEFSDIARHAKHLRAQDITAAIEIGRAAMERSIRNHPYEHSAAVRSFILHSARALAAWSSEALAKAQEPNSIATKFFFPRRVSAAPKDQYSQEVQPLSQESPAPTRIYNSIDANFFSPRPVLATRPSVAVEETDPIPFDAPKNQFSQEIQPLSQESSASMRSYDSRLRERFPSR